MGLFAVEIFFVKITFASHELRLHKKVSLELRTPEVRTILAKPILDFFPKFFTRFFPRFFPRFHLVVDMKAEIDHLNAAYRCRCSNVKNPTSNFI